MVLSTGGGGGSGLCPPGRDEGGAKPGGCPEPGTHCSPAQTQKKDLFLFLFSPIYTRMSSGQTDPSPPPHPLPSPPAWEAQLRGTHARSFTPTPSTNHALFCFERSLPAFPSSSHIEALYSHELPGPGSRSFRIGFLWCLQTGSGE